MVHLDPEVMLDVKNEMDYLNNNIMICYNDGVCTCSIFIICYICYSSNAY